MIEEMIPFLNIDFQHAALLKHYEQNTTKAVAYYIPQHPHSFDEYLIFFGLQSYIKKYLVDMFNDNFFSLDEDLIINHYKDILDKIIGSDLIDYEKLRSLHQLGYLPIEIKAIPEGTKVPLGTPMIEISNTHPDFVWVVGLMESSLRCTLRHTMYSASRAYNFRQIIDQFYELTVDDSGIYKRDKEDGAIDFSAARQQSIEGSEKTSAAFLLSFNSTNTLGAYLHAKRYYGYSFKEKCPSGDSLYFKHDNLCAFPSTCDDYLYFKQLLNEVCAENDFTILTNEDQLWEYVLNILPNNKVCIANHQGRVNIKFDASDYVHLLCGTKQFETFANEEDMYKIFSDRVDTCNKNNMIPETVVYYANILDTETYYKIQITRDEDTLEYNYMINDYSPRPSDFGVVDMLYKSFGGTKNSKGYIELPYDLRLIVGKVSSPFSAYILYSKLRDKGYASSNVILGISGVAFQDETHMDIEAKITYYEIDGKPLPVFPKESRKSLHGCCTVYKDFDDDSIVHLDGFVFDDTYSRRNLLQVVFEDGEFVRKYTFNDIRNNLFNYEN